MLPSIHPLLEYRGSPRACGKIYGDQQAERLRIFLKNIPDGGLSTRRRRYARQCWKILRRWQEPVVEFLHGVAQGSGLSLEELTALQLQEEYGHDHCHCTALGATGPATPDGAALIAQSWDDRPPLYPWPQLLRMRTDATPATLTYTMPGLWAAAGINEHGLALGWTTSGMRPKVPPQPGIPTYSLIAGILGCRDCSAALALVRRTRNAGCFNFFIADAAGEVWVLEAMPGRIEAVQCRDIITRANHYQCATIRRAAKQKLPPSSTKWNSQSRAARIAALAERFRGHIDGRAVETIYRDHYPKEGLCICQHGTPHLTLDCFYMLPAKKEFRIARGYVCRHDFAAYQV